MTRNSFVSRRLVLGGLGAGAVALAGAQGAAAATATPTSAAAAAPRATRWSGSRSANGWAVGGPTSKRLIEGTDLTVTLADGAAAAVLLHAARRINYEIDTLRKGDVTGLREDRSVESPERSNLLSGTAIHFRPGFYPYGTTGNLFPQEVVVLEDIVAESEGVLGWGGHLDVPDEGLLYLTSGPGGTVRSLAGELFEADRMNTTGGAGSIDAHDPARRRAAKAHRARVS